MSEDKTEIEVFVEWASKLKQLVDVHYYNGEKTYESLYQCQNGLYYNLERTLGYFMENKEACILQLENNDF